ncbi:MAG: OmpA family protein [Sulfurovaceae bacterium]|nr:OmpA family protein [Sulfurovaceae bacterium]
MKQSTKIIFLGLLSSIALIIACIYFKYDMVLNSGNAVVTKSLVSDMQKENNKPKIEEFTQLIDIEEEESKKEDIKIESLAKTVEKSILVPKLAPKEALVEAKSEPKALKISSLNYRMEKELITIEGEMPILENNDSLKLILMSQCEKIKCDKKILFSPDQVIPKWKELVTNTINLFNNEKMETANLKVDGNSIYISGEFVDKESMAKLDTLLTPYLTIYTIKNNTTVKAEIKESTTKIDIPEIVTPKVEIPKVETKDNSTSISIVEEKISEILKEKHINFYKSRAKITKKGQKTLDEIIVILKKHKDVSIEVHGHTDASGKRKANQWISTERAKSVKNYLGSRGLNPKNIVAKGFGETQLLLTNRPNNAINRRVEIKIKRR